jgi:hypothetical protein
VTPRAGLAAALAALAAGCASLPQPSTDPWPTDALSAAAVADVPFFAQSRYQCGPAALAMVLGASGVPVSPDSLVASVYVPARRGSFQVEILAATRRHGRIAYVVPPDFESLLREVAAGRPVLVLQNLGLARLPRWHYAVVVGYDRGSDMLRLNTGTRERRDVSRAAFVRSWALADRWAMIALVPGELPAAPDPIRFITAAAALEESGSLALAERAYVAAVDRWPRAPLPRLALANARLAQGDATGAEHILGEAVPTEPDDAAVRNNYAELLARRSCVAAARRVIEPARALAAGGPLAATVEATARALDGQSAAHDPADCP